MNAWRAWLRAARVPSQVYLVLPLLLGQALAWRATGQVSGGVTLGLLAYGTCQQLFIVFANDCADEAHDRLNPTPTWLSGGSRVLVDGQLTPRALRQAAVGMAVLAVLCAGTLACLSAAWVLLPLAGAGLLLLWAYSFAPLRLSYRGGGELLQVVGLGVVLPLMGYAAGTGGLLGFPWLLWGTLLPLQAALALATTLPDETGDRLGDKRTLAMAWGGARVRLLMLTLLAVALALWGGLHPLTGPWRLPVWQHTAGGWGAWLGLLLLEGRLRRVSQVPTQLLVWFAVGTAAVLLSWLVLVAGDAARISSLEVPGGSVRGRAFPG